MKKYILPAILTVLVVALTGVLVYREMKDEEPVPQVQDTVTETADVNEAYSCFNSAVTKLSAASAARGGMLKGIYLKEAASELEQAAESCTGNEENLKSFCLRMGAALSELGDKLIGGGTVSEEDSSNLKELTASLKSAYGTVTRARDEDNADYLRGEFTLPVRRQEMTVNREKAAELAAQTVEGAVFKEEKDLYYSFDGDGYLLEVAKSDGSIMYRRVGYTTEPAELSESRFSELADKAKELLKAKGYESTVLAEWVTADGELSMKLYPIAGDTVYLNTPLGVTLAVSDGSLLGLRTTPFTPVETADNSELLKKLQTEYEGATIAKAVNEYGAGSYLVSYVEGEGEYLSLWSMAAGQEYRAAEIHNSVYGRVIKAM